MYNTKAYSAASATSPLAHTQIKRRDPTEHDVQIEILCGTHGRQVRPRLRNPRHPHPEGQRSLRATTSSPM